MSAELIHQMYIAYYQRPADPAGLIYWQDQLNANGGGEAGWNAVAAAFANAAESTSLYGNQTLGQKISAIYLAAFERAASADEIAYWEASGFNAAQIGFAIVNGAQNDDLRTVDKKVDYAEAFVAQIDPAGTGVGPFSFQYVDASLGRSLLDPITKDSDVSSATVASQVSSTLPVLVNVNLTAGTDTVTPTANAAENISAALGGTQPTLNRADQIDGGSAQDTINVDMDGNFLLGFGSGGFMRDVEVVNLAATASSVTPKLFNFTGASGIETINVGAANAQINLSEISDPGLTVNLSGQTTGSFDVGFATGTISGTGSSMTIGVTDVGATNAISVTSDGITDLNLISYGTNNKLDLSSSVNDLVSLTISGTGNLELTAIDSGVSGLDVSGLGGDFSAAINVDDSAALVTSGQTISGGTGNDTLELNGSGIAAFTSTGIEELKFDGASGEAVVYATGMTGLNTLTFSGDAVNTPNIRGITASDLTINAIYADIASPDTYIITAQATLNVNLDVDPSNSTPTNNEFSFRSDTAEAITVNVGTNTSAMGTHTTQKAASLDVSIAASATYGVSTNVSAATSVNISGAGALSATVSGDKVQTLTVDVASGNLTFGASAISTVSVTSDDTFEFGTGTNLSGATTLTTDVGGTADLSNASFLKLQNATIGGAGDSAAVMLGTIDVSGNPLNMTFTGMADGISAASIQMTSGNVVLDASLATGKLNTTDISGTESVTITTGSAGQFSAGAVNASDGFVLDMSGKELSTSGEVLINTISSSGAVTMTIGQSEANASGVVTISSVTTESNFILDASTWGGQIHLTGATAADTLDVSSNMTVTLGSIGSFTASNNISVAQDFVLDASNAMSATLTISSKLSAGDSLTISVGQGSGSVAISAIDANIATFDASNYGGTLDFEDIQASGNATFALGSIGSFNASAVSSGGNFTIDGSNAVTATIVTGSVTAEGNVTVSLGGGSGAVTGTTIYAGGNFTLDGANFGGGVHLKDVSASGNVTVSLGGVSNFSGSSITTAGNLTVDQSPGTSASITVNSISGANVVVSLGAGSGDLTLTGVTAAGNFTLDGTLNGGSQDIGALTASGNVIVSLGTQGDFSGSSIAAGGNLTIDGAAATTADVSVGTFSATNVTISLGTGSGDLKIGDDGANSYAGGTFTLDTSTFGGDVDITSVTGSGAMTISVGGVGNFSAGVIHSAGATTIDLSNMASAGTATLNSVSADSLIMTLGAGSGTVSAGVLATIDSAVGNNHITIDGTSFKGQLNMENVSASGNVTVSLGGDGGFSASEIDAAGAFTLDNSTSTSGRVVIGNASSSGSMTISLGNATGTSAFSFSALDTAGNLTINADNVASDFDMEDISASGNITISNNAGTGTIAISAMDSLGNITISTYLGQDASSNEKVLDLQAISADKSLSVTVTGGTGVVTASSLNVGATFTLDTTASTEKTTANEIQTLSASAAVITVGADDELTISAVAIDTGGLTLSSTGSAEVTVSGYFTSQGVVTLNQAGGGEFEFSALVTASTFTFNGTALATGATNPHLDGNSIDASAAVAFNFGDGVVGNVDVSSVHTESTFTFAGSDLQSSTSVFADLSAGGAISIDMGGASGSLTLSSIVTASTFTLNAGSAPNLDIKSQDNSDSRINNINASAGITLTLGAVNDSTKQLSVSAAETSEAFTLNAGAYRESMDFQHISASTVTMTFGDLAKSFSGSSVVTSGALTINGGNGPTFSAEIKNGDIGGNFTITMGETSNGIAMGTGTDGMDVSASGVIVGTLAVDDVSVASTSQSGDELTIDFDMGEDSSADEFNFAEGAGKDLVVIRNFVTGTDSIDYDGNTSDLTDQVLDVTAAASLIGDALGLSSDPNVSDVTLNAGSAVTLYGSSIWIYNGDSYYLGGDIGGDSDGVFDAGETIFRFVGTTDFGNANTDIADI